VDAEYRAELTGIAEGVKARGSQLDLWDIVALNSWLEVTYYTKQLNHRTGGTPDIAAPSWPPAATRRTAAS
jgi:hypothetical protein